MFSCITVVVGYIAGIDGEINFSLTGTLFGVGASLVGCFYTILLHRYLTQFVTDNWELLFYNNLNSAVIMSVIVVITGEIPVLIQHSSQLTFSYFFWTMTGTNTSKMTLNDLAGLIGSLVGITTQMQIKATSSLTHNISGVVKNCIQTFMGAAIYHTQLTFKGICGVILVVSGSCCYALEQIRINNAKGEEQDVEKVQLVINRTIRDEEEEKIMVNNT